MTVRLRDEYLPAPAVTRLVVDTRRRRPSHEVFHAERNVSHCHAEDNEPLWSTRCRGFLPARDPLTTLGHPYKMLLDLVAMMPSSIADGSFRSNVDAQEGAFEEIAAAVADERSSDVLERVHGLFGYIGKGYVHRNHTATVSNGEASSVPSYLAKGWLAVSQQIGRLPTLDYADCVLYNWERIDPRAPITPENVRLLNRFTGLLDEEWFLKTHVIIESEASGVVSAITDACEAMRHSDVNKLLARLSRLEQAMSHVASSCLPLIFERQGDDGYMCEPDLFYHRFQPFISSWTALFEGQYECNERLAQLRSEIAIVERLAHSSTKLPDLASHRDHLLTAIAALQKRQELCGPSSAMSTILPVCDAFLSIQIPAEHGLAAISQLENYMPVQHRKLLESIRACPARCFILRMVQESHEHAEALVDHFNAVVRRVLDFRWRNLSYVEKYMIAPSGEAITRGSQGALDLSHLTQHISDTEAAIIVEPQSERPTQRDAGTSSAESSTEDDNEAGNDDAFTALRRSNRLHASQSSSSAHADDCEVAKGSGAENLWQVTDAFGLLPTETPPSWQSLPSSWSTLVTLASQLPAASVPPAIFRSKVEQCSTSIPSDTDALCSDGLRERGRSLLAYLLAGWGACAVNGEEEADKPPPSALQLLFESLCAQMGRAPCLSVVDLILFNWKVTPTSGDEESVDELFSMPQSPPQRHHPAPQSSPPHEPLPPSHQMRQLTRESERHPRDREEEGARAAHLGSGELQCVGRASGGRAFASEQSRPRLRTMARVCPLQRFVCIEEEDWFCRLHVTLASESGRVIRAMRQCFCAVTTHEQVKGLQQLTSAIEVLVRIHYAAGIGQPTGAHVPKVCPTLLMQRLYRFLPRVTELEGTLDVHEQRAARVYCATGIDQSCLMHLMGVQPSCEHALHCFREWQESAAGGLPCAHLDYLAACRRCMSIREQVERAVGVKNLTVQDLSRLELAHNSCIDMLQRYFNRRIELVRATFGEDTLNESWELERNNIQDARLRLLIERRERFGPRTTPEIGQTRSTAAVLATSLQDLERSASLQ